MRITKLTISNFKSFQAFVLPINRDAFLVGPNNAGKSTLIEAIRICAGMMRQASRTRPTFVSQVGSKRYWSHLLKSESLGLETENLRYRFSDHEVRLRLSLDVGIKVNAVWPAIDDDGELEGNPFFYIEYKEPDEFRFARPSTLRLPGTIGIIPTLSPILSREELLDRDYVESRIATPRTSSHLRNLIYIIEQDGEFEEFRNWILTELPEIDDLSIEKRDGQRAGRFELDVYYRENRDNAQREICWSGDGIQIYLQILAHLWRNRSASVVVLDEPDVFLHADLQRRLVRLLERQPYQTITATHSVEMLSEASEENVIWVDKSRRKAVARPTAGGFQDLSTQIGSQFNLRLATALKARIVLFVEGQDMLILRNLARTIGATDLSSETGCAVIPLQGYSNWEHVEPFQWFIRKFLRDSVKVFVILDRDFRTDSAAARVTQKLSAINISAHVWRRKELESYLIETSPMSRVTGLEPQQVDVHLMTASQVVLASCRGQYLAEFQIDIPSHVSPATKIQRAMTYFEPLFDDFDWLRQHLPAKQLLSEFNRIVQPLGAQPISAQRLSRELHADEVSAEMRDELLRIQSALTSAR